MGKGKRSKRLPVSPGLLTGLSCTNLNAKQVNLKVEMAFWRSMPYFLFKYLLPDLMYFCV